MKKIVQSSEVGRVGQREAVGADVNSCRRAKLICVLRRVISTGCLVSVFWLLPPVQSSAGPLDVWQPRSSGVGNVLNAVAFGNGVWVVVGNEGTLLTSSNGGENWVSRNVGVTTALNSIVVANDLFVVVGESGRILTSTNGTNWTSKNSGTSDFLYDVTYGGGRFVAVSDTGTVTVSLDGSTWTARATTAMYAYGVTYGNGRYVSVGGYQSGFWPFYTYVPVTYTSTDAVSWAATTSNQSAVFSDAIYGRNIFVAVGSGGTLITSADGRNWIRPTLVSGDFLWNVTFGENTFVVVGGQNGSIFTSTNGVNWVSRNSGTANGLFNVGYGDGTFVAVGQYGTIVQSGSSRPPQLQLLRSVNGTVLTWPLSAANFWLEETTDMSNPVWTRTPTQFLTYTNTGVMLNLSSRPGDRFYRLAGQQ